MIKRYSFMLSFLMMSLLHLTSFGQSQVQSNEEPCGTLIPNQAWDDWFNQQVEIYKQNLKDHKVRPQTYTIPIIVHIIHGGQPIGTYPNIDSAQVRTQLTAVNNDFAGVGFNTNTIPSVFQAVLANTDVKFCLAVKNPTGGVLTEPGIDRINYQTNNWANPSSQNSTNSIKNLIDNIIKPATMWDPTKYFNIWISDRGSGGLMGYATFPAGTNLQGLPANFLGTASSDGVWVFTKAFGTTGTLQNGFMKGRVLAHEAGHWLGLRHVWGDGNCLTDFCNDTPPAPHNHGGVANPVHPFHVNQCGAGQSTNGEMFMNFMDYTSSDAIMCMFTLDQKTRIQTAMSQGTFRSQLGTHGLCTITPPTPAPAAAQYSFATPPCAGKPFNAINQSLGGPTPTYSWSSNPVANVTITPSSTSAAPSVLFGVAGNYTLTLVATNSVNASMFSTVLTVSACPFEPICLDSVRSIRNTDTLRTYAAPASTMIISCSTTSNRGWLTGTNCYKDRQKAQFYASNSYSATTNPQINSLLVLFDTVGTKGNPNTQIYANIWGYSPITGAPSSSLIAQKQDSLLTILSNTATNNVPYIGAPLHTQTSNRIKVHSFDFNPPIPLPVNGFFASIEMPINTPNDSLLIFSNTPTNTGTDSSAWVMESLNNNWKRIKTKYGVSVKLAIIPQITCRNAIGIKEENSLKDDIHIFPNPSNGIFNIATSFSEPKNIRIEWFDCVGRMIEQTQHTNIGKQVFTSDLSSKTNGVYFVKISSGNQQSTHKIILLK